MKNLIKVGLCALLAVLFLSFQTTEAKAYSTDINYNLADNWDADVHLLQFLTNNAASFTTFDGSDLSGDYTATFIGYRAAHTNLFYDTSSYDTNNTSTFFSTGSSHSTAGSQLEINASTTYFYDNSDGAPLTQLGNVDGAIQYYQLLEDWTYNGKDYNGTDIDLNFLAGDIIVGFNDNGTHEDHMDLVVALHRSPVPIPGAIWLLGSGLLGLVGIRRRNS